MNYIHQYINNTNFGLKIDEHFNILNVIYSGTKIAEFTPQNVVGRNMIALFSIKNNAEFRRLFNKIPSQKSIEIELLLSISKTKKTWFSVTIVNKLIENNHYFELYFSNIEKYKTEVKKTKKTTNNLSDAEILNNEIMHSTEVIILRLNPNSSVASISNGALKILGYKKDELINKNWFLKIVNPKKYPDFKKGYDLFLASNKKTRVITAPVICKNGTIKTISWKTNKILINKELIGTIAIGKDITDITNSIKELKESETRFRQLAELAPIPISFIAHNGDILFVNKEYSKQFGFTTKEIPNIQTLFDISFKNILTKKAVLNNWKKELAILKSGKLIQRKRLEIFNKDGAKKIIEYSASHSNNYIYYTYLDITAQVEKEALLLQSKETFKHIAENLPIAVAGISLKNYQITFINNKFTEEFGYSKTAIQDYNIWRNFVILDDLTPEERDVVMKNLVDELLHNKDHKPKMIERKIISKNGTIKIFEIGLTLDKETIYAFFYDITKRNEAEKKLKESEERFRNIAENLPIPLVSINTDTSIIFSNKKHKELIGHNNTKKRNNKNIWDYSIDDLVDEKSKDYLQKLLKIVEKNTDLEPILVPSYQVRIFCVDKIIRTFEITETIYHKTLYSVFHDITEQKKTNELLKESEQKFKALAENMPVAIGGYDENGNAIFVNKHFTEITGYKQEEISTIKNWYKQTQPNLKRRKEFYNYWTKTVEDFRIGKIQKQPEIKATSKCKDGSFKYFSYAFSIFKNITYILLVDITDAEKSKKELEKSHLELRNFASYLQNIREEERKNISREIHDELGQQLTGIKMDISAIFRTINLEQNLQHEQAFKQVLEMLNHSVKTVRKISTQLRPSILDDLGLAAAIEWHSTEFSKRINVNCIFKNKLNIINLNTEIESNLFRVLQESLTNVMRHSMAKNVLIVLENNEKSVTLIISDDGKGFNKNLHSSTLGLLGMKERAIMMNGDFKIISEKEKGTIVKIVVPIKTINNENINWR